jgi:hypothetical protein
VLPNQNQDNPSPNGFDPKKIEALRGIYDIVDRKYGVEKDLRTVEQVSKWIKSEISEVLEALEVLKTAEGAEAKAAAETERKSEVCDLLYVLYAHMKWRTAKEREEILASFAGSPSFRRYLDELSSEDLEASREKFRQRNAYLYDEPFIEHLATIPSVARRLTEIDQYWDIIKYRDQKGFDSQAYRHYLSVREQMDAIPEDIMRAMQVSSYSSKGDIAGMAYLDRVLDGSGIEEPFLTYLKRSFKHDVDGVFRYVQACEVFIAKGLEPFDALVCASLQSRFTEHPVLYINQTVYLLEHGRHWQNYVAIKLATCDSYEAYLFVREFVDEGGSVEDGVELVVPYIYPWIPNRDGFCRVLRGYVEKKAAGYRKARKMGKSPKEILAAVWEEAERTFATE